MKNIITLFALSAIYIGLHAQVKKTAPKVLKSKVSSINKKPKAATSTSTVAKNTPTLALNNESDKPLVADIIQQPDCGPEWRKYLTTKLQPILYNATSDGLPAGSHRIICEFIVCTDGSICDVGIKQSSGYKNLDSSVIKVCSDYKNWLPALDAQGNKVKAKHSQAILFAVIEDDESKEIKKPATKQEAKKD